MRDVLMAMPTPFGFSMAHTGPAYCPTIKSIYPNLGGYRLLQDQSRPEYAVLFTNSRLASVKLETVKDLPAVSYTSEFISPFELLWMKSVTVPDDTSRQIAVISSSTNRANFMVKVTTPDLEVCTNVFNEQVKANVAVLLRLHVNIKKEDLDSINVEILSGQIITPPEGKTVPSGYIVSTSSDEIIGTVHDRGEASAYYSVNLVTADVQLAAALLAVCMRT